jgi:hypothetical protein
MLQAGSQLNLNPPSIMETVVALVPKVEHQMSASISVLFGLRYVIILFPQLVMRFRAKDIEQLLDRRD